MENRAGQATQSPAVAGLFYPAEPHTLQHDVDQFLLQAQAEIPMENTGAQAAKALIVPHAAYIYSGAVAAAAYAQLLPYASQINRVVIFAPAHRLAFRGLATVSADQYRTPLGLIPVDRAARQQLLAGDFPVATLDEAFREEHALEVQLPFLQRILADFTLLPVLVGDADPVEVMSALNQCWGGPETLIVISSDLSHFHDYETAEQKDRHTTKAIESMQPDDIGTEDACGRLAINGLLLAAREKELQVKTVARCNSGDTGGGRLSVVGYGAYVFS